MVVKASQARRDPGLGTFERYLTLWVLLCIGVGILLGRLAPEVARYLDRLAIDVGGAPAVSIPIAVALFLMMYPIVMVPSAGGYVTRRGLGGRMGEAGFGERFVPWLTPVSVVALLLALVLLFTFKGETIVANPFTILWIAIPLFLQTWLIFGITHGLARVAAVPVRGCGSFGDARGREPLRGRDCAVDDVVRAFVGGRAGNSGRGLDRGPGDAHAGSGRPANPGMVRAGCSAG